MSSKMDENINQLSSERLKYIRNEIGMTQDKFSQILGININQVKSIESGKVKISSEIALAIEENFNYSFKWILTGLGAVQNEVDKGNPFKNSISEIGHPYISELYEIVKQFENQDAVLDIAKDLVEVEKLSPEVFENIRSYIKGTKNGITVLSKTMNQQEKKSTSWNGIERRRKAAR